MAGRAAERQAIRSAGANNYWMNQDGESFTTDDDNDNLNTDPGMYDQQWQQLEAD